MNPITPDDIEAAVGPAANEPRLAAPEAAHAPATERRMCFTQEELDALLETTRSAERLRLINTPEIKNFLEGVALEAQHQRHRWGTDHDAGKTTWDWVFLIGHLSTRAGANLMAGNMEKALHHAITTAAACLNWHAAMQGQCDMRPGIEGEQQKVA